MSTALYAAITRKREEATPTKSESDAPPGVGSYADALSALVPAEVLIFYGGLALPHLTDTVKTAGHLETKIAEPGWLKGAFLFSIVMCLVIYFFVHVGGNRRLDLNRFDEHDIWRIFLAPVAFIAWGMLQTPSSFDVFAINVNKPVGEVIAAVIAIGVLLLGRVSGKTADGHEER